MKNTFYGLVSLIHPEDKSDAISEINDYILSQSSSYESVYRMVCRNGKEKWILSKAKSIRNSEGKIIRMAGSHTSLSDSRWTFLKVYILLKNNI